MSKCKHNTHVEVREENFIATVHYVHIGNSVEHEMGKGGFTGMVTILCEECGQIWRGRGTSAKMPKWARVAFQQATTT